MYEVNCVLSPISYMLRLRRQLSCVACFYAGCRAPSDPCSQGSTPILPYLEWKAVPEDAETPVVAHMNSQYFLTALTTGAKGAKHSERMYQRYTARPLRSSVTLLTRLPLIRLQATGNNSLRLPSSAHLD